MLLSSDVALRNCGVGVDGETFYGYVLKVELATLADDLDVASKGERNQR